MFYWFKLFLYQLHDVDILQHEYNTQADCSGNHGLPDTEIGSSLEYVHRELTQHPVANTSHVHRELTQHPVANTSHVHRELTQHPVANTSHVHRELTQHPVANTSHVHRELTQHPVANTSHVHRELTQHPVANTSPPVVSDRGPDEQFAGSRTRSLIGEGTVQLNGVGGIPPMCRRCEATCQRPRVRHRCAGDVRRPVRDHVFATDVPAM